MQRSVDFEDHACLLGAPDIEVPPRLLCDQFLAALLKFVAHELEEDEPEDNVFVFGGFDGAAELVGGVPKGFLDGFGGFFFGHGSSG